MLIYGFGFSQTISKPTRDLSIVCKDTDQLISFSVSGSFDSATIFKVLLSDDQDDFSASTELGQVTYVSGVTNYAETFSLLGVSIDKYYIKIVSTITVTDSPVSDPFSIVINDPIDISADGPTEFCEGSSVSLINNVDDRILEWFKEGTPAVSQGYHKELEVTISGSYYAINELGGCTEKSDVFEITVTHTPTSSIVDEFDVLEMDRDICAPDTYKFYAETNDASLDNPYFEWLNESDAVVGTGTSFETSIAGTYRLKTINYGNLSPGGGCPTLSDPVILTVHDFESIIEEVSPIRNCEGTLQSLTSSEKNPNYTYRWFKGSNEILDLVQPAIVYNLPEPTTSASNGNYTLVVESPGCDKTSDIVKVTFVPIPVSIIDPAINKDLCRGDSYTLTQASTNTFGVIEFQWLKDGVAITDISEANEILVIDTSGDEAGDYEYTLITYNGNETCNHISDPVIVTVHDFVAEIIEAGPMEICSGEEITLTSREQNIDYTYNWRKNGVILPDPISGVGKTSYTFTSTETDSGDYTLEIISPACTKESTPVLTILIKDSPVFNIVEGNQSGCNGDIVTLTSSLDDIAYKYQWYRNGLAIDGETSESIDVVVNSLTPVEYYLGMSFGNCSVASEKVTVTEVPKPISRILEGSEIIGCVGDEAVLSEDSDLNGSDPLKVVYEWIDASNTVKATGPEFKTTIAGDYRLVTKNENVCTDTSSVSTIIFSEKANSIISYTSLADCDEVTLTANGDLLGEDSQRVVYRWLDDNDVLIHESTDYTDVNLVISKSGIYKLQTLNYGICLGTIDQVTVSINDLDPEINEPVPHVKVCVGNTYQLLAEETDPTYTYSWYLNGATIPVKTGNENYYDVTSAVEGDFSYTLRVESPECDKLSKTPVVLEIKDLPEAVITNGNLDACETDTSVILTSEETSDFYTYKWYKDGVIITDTDGIDSQLTVDVNLLEDAYTKFKLQISFGDNCYKVSSESNLYKVVAPNSSIDLEGQQVVCGLGNTIVLTTTSDNLDAPVTYEWYKDGVVIPGATSTEYEATVSGDYTLVTINRGVCLDESAPTTVVITPSVVAKISPSGDVNVCDEVLLQSVSENTGPNTTYEWYFNDVLIPTVVGTSLNANQAGKYYFKAYNYGVCGGQSEDVNVSFTEFEREIAEYPIVKQCVGTDVVLNSVNTDEVNFEFAWYKGTGGFPLGSGISYTILGDEVNSGEYYLKVTEKGAQCTKTSEPVSVFILPDPVSMINLGGGYNCEGTIVTLNSDETNVNYDYTWYLYGVEILDGDANYQDVNTASLSVTMFKETEGVYTLKVSVGTCNTGLSNSVNLDMDDVDPQLDIDPGTTLCKDGSILITINTIGEVTQYEWFLNNNIIPTETSQAITVSTAGNYKARVTSLVSSCTQLTEEISIVAAPDMGVVEDTLYVNTGQVGTFEAYGGDSYEWYDSDGDVIQTGGTTLIVDNVQGNMVYQVRISNSYCDELIDLLIISGEITADDVQNMITPNGDGFNDTWKLPAGFVTSGDEVILLNRQGSIVYKSTDYKDDWRGTFNDGPALPAATYYYVIKRIDEEPIMGSITIFR